MLSPKFLVDSTTSTNSVVRSTQKCRMLVSDRNRPRDNKTTVATSSGLHSDTAIRSNFVVI